MSKNFVSACPHSADPTLVLLHREEAGVDVILESYWGQTRCTDKIRHLDNERQLKFEESAALKTGHSPSLTLLSLILNIILGNALPPFPPLPLFLFQQLLHHSFLLTLTDLTPSPSSPLPAMTQTFTKVHQEWSSSSKPQILLYCWRKEHTAEADGEGLYICVMHHGNHQPPDQLFALVY